MKHKLLVVLGPTSTGKTDLAINLAKRFNGEIVSADSRQVYKYLDIGTGKLPGQFKELKKEDKYWEIDGIKIWMYDVANPEVRFNLYQYILKAREVIEKIIKNGKLPVLTGGTGLYIRSLLEGVSDFGIGEDSELRNELENQDIEEIKRQIEAADPEALKSLNNSELNNKRRLVRLLEKLTIPRKAGFSFSGLEKDLDILKVGLKADKQTLNLRINKRVLSRIDQGMIEESKSLLEKNILNFQRMEELGLEYRYLAKLLGGGIKTVDEFIKILSLKISQFAKRQMTWFKKEKNVLWFDTRDADFSEQVVKTVRDWYNIAS